MVVVLFHAVYLTLESGPRITTNNTEILITVIGEDAVGLLPSLTCHTDLTTCCRSSDNNGMGGLGQWTFPGGSVVLNDGGSTKVGHASHAQSTFNSELDRDLCMKCADFQETITCGHF